MFLYSASAEAVAAAKAAQNEMYSALLTKRLGRLGVCSEHLRGEEGAVNLPCILKGGNFNDDYIWASDKSTQNENFKGGKVSLQ